MEITYSALQTVADGQNVLFNETPVCGKCAVHRDGSGVVTLRGATSQCRARYRVHFGANIAIPTDGTVTPISVAISLRGEPLAASTAIATPAAVETFSNVSLDTYVEVPCGCCTDIAIENTSGQAIDVQNANLIVERVC